MMNAVSVMSSHGLSLCQTVFVPDLDGPVLEADDDAVRVRLDVEHLWRVVAASKCPD